MLESEGYVAWEESEGQLERGEVAQQQLPEDLLLEWGAGRRGWLSEPGGGVGGRQRQRQLIVDPSATVRGNHRSRRPAGR